jgi:hypothetical protein
MILDPEARKQIKELKEVLKQLGRTLHQQPTWALADSAIHMCNQLLEGEIYYGHRETTKQSKDSTGS